MLLPWVHPNFTSTSSRQPSWIPPGCLCPAFLCSHGPCSCQSRASLIACGRACLPGLPAGGGPAPWGRGGRTSTARALSTAWLQLAFRSCSVGGQIKEGTCAYRQWLAPRGGGAWAPGPVPGAHRLWGAVRAQRSTVREQTFVSWGWHCDSPPRRKHLGAGWAEREAPPWGDALFARKHHKSRREGRHPGPSAAPALRDTARGLFSLWARVVVSIWCRDTSTGSG